MISAKKIPAPTAILAGASPTRPNNPRGKGWDRYHIVKRMPHP